MLAFRSAASLFALTIATSSCGSANGPNLPKGVEKSSADTSASAAATPAPAPEKDAYVFLDIDVGCSVDPVFSQDGTRVAMCRGSRNVLLRNARDGAILQQFEVPGLLRSLRFQDDGKRLLAFTDLGAIAWDTASGTAAFSIGAKTIGSGNAMFSPSGQWLAIVEHVGTARIINVASGKVEKTLTMPAGSQLARFGTKSDRLLTWSGHVATEQKWVLWDIPSGKKLAEPKDQDAYLSPDMYLALVSDSEYGMARLVDAASGAQQWSHKWPTGGGTAASWTLDGRQVALVSLAPGATESSHQAQLSILDMATQKLTALPFRIAPPYKKMPEWGRDNRVLFVGRPVSNIMDTPQEIALDATTGKRLDRAPAPGMDPSNIADPAGNFSIKRNPDMHMLDGKTGATLWSDQQPTPSANFRGDFAISSSEPIIAMTRHNMANGETEKLIRVMKLDTGEEWSISEQADFPPEDMQIEGSTLVGLGSNSNTSDHKHGGVRVWSLRKGGEVVKTINIGNERAYEKNLLTTERRVALSPDGKYVALGHGANVELWDTTTGKMLKEVPGVGGITASNGQVVPIPPRQLRFAPTGNAFVIEQDVLRTIRVPSGEVAVTLERKVIDWWLRQDGALTIVEKYRKETIIDWGVRTVAMDAITGKIVSTSECDVTPYGSLPEKVSPNGAFVIKLDDVWEVSTCKRQKLPPATGAVGFSPDSKYVLSTVATGPEDKATLAISLSTLQVERGIRISSDWTGLLASGPFVVFKRPSKITFWNPATGAAYQVHLVSTSKEFVTSTDGGRFEASDEMANHVRIFVPGAQDGRIVLQPDGVREFRTKNLFQAFFGKQ